MKVIDTKAYHPISFQEPLIGECKYFSSSVHNVKDIPMIQANKESFISITFLTGEGSVNSIPYKALDTFFIPAEKEAVLKGSGTFVLTTVNR